jgi:hypothetical protein
VIDLLGRVETAKGVFAAGSTALDPPRSIGVQKAPIDGNHLAIAAVESTDPESPSLASSAKVTSPS